MTKRLAVFLSVLSLLLAPALAWAVNVTTNVKNGQETATGQLTLKTSDGKTITAKNGETVDVGPPGTKVRIWHREDGYWDSKWGITADRDKTLTYQGRPIYPVHNWAPPSGVLSFGVVEQNFYVGDLKKTSDIFIDRTTLGVFANRADANQLRQDNNDDAHRLDIGITGMYAKIGLPVFSWSDCECWFFTHALGTTLGNGHTGFHVHDRQDNQASNTTISGDGFAWGLEYTATALVREGMGVSSRFGFRGNYSYFSGISDGSRTPRDSQGLSGLGAVVGNPSEAQIDWSVQKVSLDVLYRPSTPSLYLFVGAELRYVSGDVSTSNPVIVPGFGNVQREIHQRYSNTNVMPRFGVDGMLPTSWLPSWMWPIFVRGEATLGPGGSGFMVKMGTGFSVPALVDKLKGP
jgi:hypothetical protein